MVGAALSLIDGMLFPLYIQNVTFAVIGYGLPRVCAKFRQSTQSRLIYIYLGWESSVRELY